jgi:hypothetical protein
MIKKTIIKLGIVTIVLSLFACIKGQDFNTLSLECNSDLSANSTYSEIKNLFDEETFQIQEDLIIEGYITSSDREGNFFSVLHFQDKAVNPTDGFQLEMDMIDSHLFFPEGSKVFVKLKGLYLGKSKEVYKLGGTFTAFGNISVGRLPANAVRQHFFISCDQTEAVQPKLISINEVDQNASSTLVQFNGVQIINEDLNQPFALEREETERTLVDCDGNELVLINSGYSDFFDEILPSGNGSIKGVLLRERDNYHLVTRNREDIDFSNKRCE